MPSDRAHRRRYWQSPQGKAVRRRYEQSAKGRAKAKEHNAKPNVKASKARYWAIHGLDIQRRHNRTEKRRMSVRRYQHSAKGQEAFRRLAAQRHALKEIETSLTPAKWQAILDAYDHRCAYCGHSDLKLEQDHVVPVTKGGQHTAENVVPACRSCNARKHARLDFAPSAPISPRPSRR